MASTVLLDRSKSTLVKSSISEVCRQLSEPQAWLHLPGLKHPEKAVLS